METKNATNFCAKVAFFFNQESANNQERVNDNLFFSAGLVFAQTAIFLG